jgi:molybdate transport system substrate-binding protein
MARALLLLILALLLPRLAAAQEIVAVAANVRPAAEAAAAAYGRNSGQTLRLVFGASGNFVQQIANGAPFALFLAADAASVDRLVALGRTVDGGQVYAVGRLALVARPDSGLGLDPRLKGLGAALAAGRVKRLSIANPETAPYGARAVEALTAAGLIALARPRLVTGASVGQALQFVASGAAEAGLVAESQVQAPEVSAKLASVRVDPALHTPLVQKMVLLRGAGPAARGFQAFLLGPEGQAILARHGYGPPPPMNR